MKKYLGFTCSLCGEEYLPDQVQYSCPVDGGNLDVRLDIQGLKQQFSPGNVVNEKDQSLWRFLPLLPVEDPGGHATPLRAAGMTPVFSLDRLAAQFGMAKLWLKDESRNPTASFKDRASAIVVARALQNHVEVVVTASTGNAGAALAGMAAAAGQQAVIFAPRTAPPAKVAQLLVFGAKVILVEGNYDQAFDLSIEASQEFGWYCRNTGYNPFTAEGKKTAAFEIWEWMKANINISTMRKSMNIFVSVGDGNIISGIHKGFKDLQALGWLDGMPRLFGIQAEGSAAIANTFFAGGENVIPVSAHTLADSISVDLPRDGVRAVRAVRETGGQYILVSDQEILNAISLLGSSGVFAEPAGATAFAGLIKARQMGQVQPDDPALVLNTGSGLKDVRAAMQAVPEAVVIEPTLEALKRVLK